MTQLLKALPRNQRWLAGLAVTVVALILVEQCGEKAGKALYLLTH